MPGTIRREGSDSISYGVPAAICVVLSVASQSPAAPELRR